MTGGRRRMAQDGGRQKLLLKACSWIRRVSNHNGPWSRQNRAGDLSRARQPISVRLCVTHTPLSTSNSVEAAAGQRTSHIPFHGHQKLHRSRRTCPVTS